MKRDASNVTERATVDWITADARCVALLKRHAALAGRFAALRPRVFAMTAVLTAPGVPPTEALLSDLAGVGGEFRRFADDVRAIAATIGYPIAEPDCASLQALKIALVACGDHIEDAQTRATAWIERIAPLDRVLTLRHKFDPTFPPLAACQDDALALRDRVVGGDDADIAPFVRLLDLLDGRDSLPDDIYAKLRDQVERDFPRELATAVERGRIVVDADAPPMHPVASAPPLAPPLPPQPEVSAGSHPERAAPQSQKAAAAPSHVPKSRTEPQMPAAKLSGAGATHADMPDDVAASVADEAPAQDADQRPPSKSEAVPSDAASPAIEETRVRVAAHTLGWTERWETLPQAWLGATWLAGCGDEVPIDPHLIVLARRALPPVWEHHMADTEEDGLTANAFTAYRHRMDARGGVGAALWVIGAGSVLLHDQLDDMPWFYNDRWLDDAPSPCRAMHEALTGFYSMCSTSLAAARASILPDTGATDEETTRKYAAAALAHLLDRQMKFRLGIKFMNLLKQTELPWLVRALDSKPAAGDPDPAAWAKDLDPANQLDRWTAILEQNYQIEGRARAAILRDLIELRAAVLRWDAIRMGRNASVHANSAVPLATRNLISTFNASADEWYGAWDLPGAGRIGRILVRSIAEVLFLPFAPDTAGPNGQE